ncbi:hypothetical protein K469DRAFT_744332 [Zopfia rhizophila CBS 207.26]|uniref:BZIP domain-containing protein n=1 Tax=Zopfia rhizophila CBS 207.26 TaxID=1314779 RepID=A0A6A6F1A1_9PEZI|nr:hypothetical protein K469DRAFT_744332 [Zopfia rhizophila CBS 207.26]
MGTRAARPYTTQDDEPPTDALERRRWQNRVSQRNHRQKLKERIVQLEERLTAQERRPMTNFQCKTPKIMDGPAQVHGFDMGSTATEPPIDPGIMTSNICPVCNGSGLLGSLSTETQSSTLLSQMISTSQGSESMSFSPISEEAAGSCFESIDGSFFPSPASPQLGSVPGGAGSVGALYLMDASTTSASAPAIPTTNVASASTSRPAIFLISNGGNNNGSRHTTPHAPSVAYIGGHPDNSAENSQHAMYLIRM